MSAALFKLPAGAKDRERFEALEARVASLEARLLDLVANDDQPEAEEPKPRKARTRKGEE